MVETQIYLDKSNTLQYAEMSILKNENVASHF